MSTYSLNYVSYSVLNKVGENDAAHQRLGKSVLNP